MDENRRDNGGAGPSRYVGGWRGGSSRGPKDKENSDSEAWRHVVIYMPPSRTPVFLPLVEWMTSFDKSSSIMSGVSGTERDSSKTKQETQRQCSLGCQPSSIAPSSDDFIILTVLWTILLRTNTIQNNVWRSLRTIPWSLVSKLKVIILSCVIK